MKICELSARKVYFDADEFALLAEFYNSEANNAEAESIIEEGLTMHPGSSELMILKAKTACPFGKLKQHLVLLDICPTIMIWMFH